MFKYHFTGGDRGGSFGSSDRGGSSFSNRGDMEIQQDTIFVSGMGEDVSEEGLVQHFGSIGVIKVTHFISLNVHANLSIL